MRNKNDKILSPCIISWAKFAPKIKLDKPKNPKKCTETYWQNVIDTILSKPEYIRYCENRNLAF